MKERKAAKEKNRKDRDTPQRVLDAVSRRIDDPQDRLLTAIARRAEP